MLEFEARKAAVAQAEKDRIAREAAEKAEAERLQLLEEGPKAIKRKEKLLRQIEDLQVRVQFAIVAEESAETVRLCRTGS